MLEILAGSSFILGGILAIAFNKKTTLSCRRAEPESPPCELTVSGIIGSRKTQIPLSSIRSAIVETLSDSDDGDTYGVQLLTETGKISLSSVWDSRRDAKQKLAAKINNFLENPNEQFLLAEESPSWTLYLLGSIFVLVGIALVVLGIRQ